MRHRIRRVRALAVIVCVSASGAQAADLDGMPPIWGGVEPKIEASPFGGFYGGANLGYSFGTGGSATTDGTGGSTATQWGDAPVYSAFAGYNFVAGRFVWGLEAELMRGSLGAGALDGVANVSTFLDYQATARVRAGFLVTPSLLLYGKAGGSYAGMTFTDTPTSSTASSSFYGFTAGVGAEWKISDRVGLRLDYDYNTFNSGNVTFPSGPASFSPAYNTLRLGVTVKF